MKITYKQDLSEIIEYFKENKNLVSFINSIALKFLKYLIETLLETKVEYERSKALIKRNWYRNGYYTRHLITKFGLIENIRVPRLRYMTYHNNIFDKWERRLSDVNDFITKVFTQGESYRDIKRIVKDFFNEPTMSLSTISRITNKVFDRLKKFHNRRIENKYSIIWIDGMYFSIKDQKEELEIYNKKLKKRRNFCVLIALGLNKKTNKKEIIDFLLVGKETKRNYKKFINSLIDRGLDVNELELFVHDGDFSIVSAINEIFGDIVKQQNCIFHKLKNLSNAIKNKDLKEEILGEASEVYKSKSYFEYIEKKKEFIKRYSKIEPEAVAIFSSDELIKTKYSMDLRLHHLIHTTNPIERTIREIRRRTNAIGCFENLYSADKILYLIVGFINQELFGNASFNYFNLYTNFGT